MIFQSVGLFEFVPFIMVDIPILIQINGVENVLICVLKIRRKLLPVYEFIAVGIDITEEARAIHHSDEETRT